MLCRICKAVSEYYEGQFVKHWKDQTKQESGKIKVVAALLVEKRGKMRVVVLTAGTKHKSECSYFVNKSSDESSWGLCDGHAEAICYRLADVYLMTEIYKLHEEDDSIFEMTPEGYALKANIYFHLFTSHPPCGFMAKKERHFLSWKRPFIGKPHSLQCSSQILIGAYLGIQGSLSHLLVKPIYVSSITMPSYQSYPTLHGTYIKDRLEQFKGKLHDVSSYQESEYQFHIPHVEIVEIDMLKLFPECFRPYTFEKPCNLPATSDQLPQQETTTVAKQSMKGAKKTAFATPDVIGNHGINTVVFTLEDGIGSEEYRKSVLQLKSRLIKLPKELKQRRLKSLQDARIRLSEALNVSEALGVLKKVIIEKMDEKITERCKKSDGIISLLSETKEHKTKVEELKAQVCKLKDGLCKAMQMNDLKSIVNALTHNLDFQVMLNDLECLLETEKSHSSDPDFYLNLMGCNWIRYMKTICDDIK